MGCKVESYVGVPSEQVATAAQVDRLIRYNQEIVEELTRTKSALRRCLDALSQYANQQNWNRLASYEFNTSPGWHIAQHAIEANNVFATHSADPTERLATSDSQ